MNTLKISAVIISILLHVQGIKLYAPLVRNIYVQCEISLIPFQEFEEIQECGHDTHQMYI